jgi:antitoxin component YwqK of YwqJK toxin-antitoxin module
MISSPNQPVAGRSGRRRLVLTVALVSVVAGVIFLAHRHGSRLTAPLPEVHRKNLELRAGRWYEPGQTNGFTGVLLDTYDDEALRSRSTVSNGALHGLSQGWHTNGQQQVEEHFQAGTSHGVRTKWYEDGTKLSEAMIVDGKLHGTFRRWHPNGSLAEEVVMKQGEPEGISRAYYPSGFLKAEAHLLGGRVLERQSWRDGELKRAVLVQHDAPTGLAR